MSKKKLFSVTKKDLRIDAFRGSGDGGQAKQKTSSGIRITHIPSGAVGKATDHREQSRNKTLALERMVATKVFKNWIKVEAARLNGTLERIENEVAESMKKVKTESKDQSGRWVEGLTEEMNP